MQTPSLKTFLSLVLSVGLVGCASGGSSTSYSNTEYIRNTQGQTLAKIRDGNVYTPTGIRTHRIDSSGNIYSVQGKTAGMRIGKISR